MCSYLLILHSNVEAQMDFLLLLDFRKWMLKNLKKIFFAYDRKVLLLYVVLLSTLVTEFLLWRPFKYTHFIDIMQN